MGYDGHSYSLRTAVSSWGPQRQKMKKPEVEEHSLLQLKLVGLTRRSRGIPLFLLSSCGSNVSSPADSPPAEIGWGKRWQAWQVRTAHVFSFLSFPFPFLPSQSQISNLARKSCRPQALSHRTLFLVAEEKTLKTRPPRPSKLLPTRPTSVLKYSKSWTICSSQ